MHDGVHDDREIHCPSRECDEAFVLQSSSATLFLTKPGINEG